MRKTSGNSGKNDITLKELTRQILRVPEGNKNLKKKQFKTTFEENIRKIVHKSIDFTNYTIF